MSTREESGRTSAGTTRIPVVSVQICSYDRPSQVVACLDALSRQTYPAGSFEVVLVDDGSPQPLASVVDPTRYPFTLRLLQVTHGGLARARNAGIRAATGEIVLFLDDDTIADEGLIEAHASAHARHPRSVVLGWVNHVDPRRPQQRRRVRLADLSTSFFWTSNASVRRDDLFEAGLFDEAFVEYGWEDVEFGERLRDLGLRRRRNRRAVVSHVKERWRATDLPRLLAQAEASGRSAAVFVAKRPTRRAKLATGIGRFRMAANRLLEPGERWFRRRFAQADDGPVTGVDWVAAYLWTRVAYFRAVRIAQNAPSQPPRPGPMPRSGPSPKLDATSSPGPTPRPGRPPRVDPTTEIREVVAILTERVGDLIVATPALRNIRTSRPAARITLICPPAVVDVLRGWDAVDDIVVYDPRSEADERLRFVSAMRAKRFDLSIALTSNWPAYELGRAVGARTRAGVVYGANILPSLAARLFLTHPVRVWIREPAREGNRFAHRAEELLRMNAALGLDATPRPLELPLSDADRDRARARLASLGVSHPVVLHLAARWLQEGWTARDVAQLADDLGARLPGGLLLTAGPSDGECASILRDDPRFPLVADADFREWAAILGEASAVVTHDTSAVHVGSALGRPVVAVYETKRYVVQSQHWAPWMVPHRVLRKTDPSTTTREVVAGVRSLLAEVGQP